MEFVQEHLKSLRTQLDKYPILHKLEVSGRAGRGPRSDAISLETHTQDQTAVPKEFLVLGALVLGVLFAIFGIGGALLSSLVGFIYPAFKSFEAIETKTKTDDHQWLVYWVIFAFLTILETFADLLVYWIPFYYAFKTAFLFWCFAPQTNGAHFLYQSFLKDFLKKNESKIDAALANAKKQAESIASEFDKKDT